MKRSISVPLLLAVVLAMGGAVGCKKRAKSPTPVPARAITPAPQRAQLPPEDTGAAIPSGDRSGATGLPLPPATTPTDTGPIPYSGAVDFNSMKADAEFFRANTVYFDFDQSAIKASQRSKIEAVAQHLQANGTQAVRVAGHCDERGTEGYNLSLGQRRAEAVREYLVRSGVPADRIDTISFGESQPAAPGHNEAAWSKNRRAEFILLTP